MLYNTLLQWGSNYLIIIQYIIQLIIIQIDIHIYIIHIYNLGFLVWYVFDMCVQLGVLLSDFIIFYFIFGRRLIGLIRIFYSAAAEMSWCKNFHCKNNRSSIQNKQFTRLVRLLYKIAKHHAAVEMQWDSNISVADNKYYPL